MSPKHVVTIQDFFPKAKGLRREFESKFQNPKQTLQDRFVWDYWYVKDQYRLIRTLAENIFSQTHLNQFVDALTAYGQKHLGCTHITQPWVSYYVDGCEQQLHADVPHGPWAYVFSLTLWNKRKFDGGETILLKNETLDYWSHFEQMNGIEMPELTTKIPAKFNQLLVFDPRIPHGVTRVNGVKDPLEARLVIHGWFTHPQPILQGALTNERTQKRINEMILSMEDIYEKWSDVSGQLCVHFEISQTGHVQKLKYLTNTLVSRQRSPTQQLLHAMKVRMEKVVFSRAKGKTIVTIPFHFQSS